ncbi:MAG TPA: hypothetical protein VIH54_20880 [Chthoniobacterales bacterium]
MRLALPETAVAFAHHGTGNATQTEPEQRSRWDPYVVENRACLHFYRAIVKPADGFAEF